MIASLWYQLLFTIYPYFHYFVNQYKKSITISKIAIINQREPKADIYDSD